MSYAILNAVWPLRMPHGAKSALVCLADMANDAGECWPALTTISDRACMSRSSVIRAIAWLEESKAITCDRSNGRHTRYVVTIQTFQPVSMRHQCQGDTGSNMEPTSVNVELDQCQGDTGPVSPRHSNHQESPRNNTNSNHQGDPPKKRSASVVELIPKPPDWIDPAAWSGFVAMRKAEKHPLTPRAAENIFRKLDRMRRKGHDPTECLDQSTTNGWRDVYAPKPDTGATHAAHPPHRESLADRVARKCREADERDARTAAGWPEPAGDAHLLVAHGGDLRA